MTRSRVPSSNPPIAIGFPCDVWLAVGVFGLVAGVVVLVSTGTISDRLVWLAENYRTEASPLSEERLSDFRQAVQVWGWSGIIAGSISLTIGQSYFRSRLLILGSWLAGRLTRPLPLAADRYGGAFFLAAGCVLVFTALAHWSLTVYEDVDWFEGEDGVSEWWSVATYSAAAALASATAWKLRESHQQKLALLHLFLAAVFLVGALEEISWGQRLFDWGTPDVLSAVNQQGETTIHNVGGLNSVISRFLFWASVVGLISAAVRAFWHQHGRVTSADFIWPSLVLSPALLMILVWRMGGIWTPVNLPRLIMISFDLGPQGSEVPEVLIGLCICIYAYSNLRRARTLVRIKETRTRSDDTRTSLQ